MLVMYSRFHNFVARTLAAINKGGRFSLSPRLSLGGQLKRDNDLFQVARLWEMPDVLTVGLCMLMWNGVE